MLLLIFLRFFRWASFEIIEMRLEVRMALTLTYLRK